VAFGFLPFLDFGSWTVNVTTQLPGLRVFSLDPDLVQTFFDDSATEMDMLALVETFFSPTVLTKLLAAYVFLAAKTCGDIVNAGI
jgi:hypothetical protein